MRREHKKPLSQWLESLKGDRTGQYSIRINQPYRVCFTWENEQAWTVEIVDYHYALGVHYG